jgi:predicted dehydrogenase
MRTPLRVGVVGLTARGLRLAKIFDDLPQTDLRWLCDKRPELRAVNHTRNSGARIAADPAELFDDESLDIVVVATPAESHYELVGRAMDANKHVFVNEPLARTGDEADDLVDRAARIDRRIMVAHRVLFHPGVTKVKELIDTGQLGEIYYLASSRLEYGAQDVFTGPFADAVAVLMHLIGDQPIEVAARTESYIRPDAADVVLGFLKFATGITAHAQVSRLDPRGLAQVTAVGSKGAVAFDDTGSNAEVTVYENAARVLRSATAEDLVVLGDVVRPRLPRDDPELVACERFLTSVHSPALAGDNAREAAAIVHAFNAAARSADYGGRPEGVTGAPAQATVVELHV